MCEAEVWTNHCMYSTCREGLAPSVFHMRIIPRNRLVRVTRPISKHCPPSCHIRVSNASYSETSNQSKQKWNRKKDERRREKKAKHIDETKITKIRDQKYYISNCTHFKNNIKTREGQKQFFLRALNPQKKERWDFYFANWARGAKKQKTTLYNNSMLWIRRIWAFNWLLTVKHFPQISHLWGFSPVCVRRCSLRLCITYI